MSDELIFMHGGRIPRCVVTLAKRFNYHLLQMSASGGLNLWRDGQLTALVGPHVWLCHPGPWYRFQETPRGQPWNHRYLAFTGALALQWESSGLLSAQPQALPPGQVRSWARRFDRLIEQSQRGDRWSRLRGINLLEGMLIDLAEQRDSSLHDPPAWLNRVLERLRETQEPDYRMIAADQSMSLSALQRRFRSATGLSLHAYRLQHRIATARRLLGETDFSIKQIAQELGYRDVFYFTRQFKQHVGVAPGRFRQSRERMGE